MEAYDRDIAAFIGWCCENGVPPDCKAVTRETLFQYVGSLGHLSPNTIRRRVHGLSSFCNYLVDIGTLQSNPARGLPLPKRNRTRPTYPDRAQAGLLMAAAETPRERAVIHLLLTAGLRRSELIGLDVDDLQADGTQLRVVGKGSRERIIPLPHHTQTVVGEYLDGRSDDEEALILNLAGNRIGPTSLRRMVRRIITDAGLDNEGYTIHSMRHAYATMLVKAGVDLATVRDLLGHSDISVTSQYLHSDSRSKRNAVQTLPKTEEEYTNE